MFKPKGKRRCLLLSGASLPVDSISDRRPPSYDHLALLFAGLSLSAWSPKIHVTNWTTKERKRENAKEKKTDPQRSAGQMKRCSRPHRGLDNYCTLFYSSEMHDIAFYRASGAVCAAM